MFEKLSETVFWFRFLRYIVQTGYKAVTSSFIYTTHAPFDREAVLKKNVAKKEKTSPAVIKIKNRPLLSVFCVLI
jgi:hypothetical protein